MDAELSANSGDRPVKRSKFFYWLVGVLLIIKHPIKRPIDLARTMELLIGDVERIRP